MKKPLPEDFLLRSEIISWCGTRERELDALSYKQFLSKIWTGLFAVGVILYKVINDSGGIKKSSFENFYQPARGTLRVH